MEQSRLKEGDRVAYKFRGESFQSTAEVVRVRENKERTEAGDTVTTIHYDVTECETTHAESQAGVWVCECVSMSVCENTLICSAGGRTTTTSFDLYTKEGSVRNLHR